MTSLSTLQKTLLLPWGSLGNNIVASKNELIILEGISKNLIHLPDNKLLITASGIETHKGNSPCSPIPSPYLLLAVGQHDQQSFWFPVEGRHCCLLCVYSKQITYTDKLFLKQIKSTSSEMWSKISQQCFRISLFPLALQDTAAAEIPLEQFKT